MNMHQCSRCGQNKIETDFHKKKGRVRGRQDICKACRRLYQKNWYGANHEKQLALVAKRKKRVIKEIQSKIIEYLQNHSCVDCGETDIIVLQFDHVKGKKKYNISNMIRSVLSWKKISAEIKKCEVRCANDHIRRTSKIQKSYRCKFGPVV